MTQSTLQAEIKKRQPFDSLEQEAFLNLLRTSDQLNCEFTRLFAAHSLSGPQYNVLRILRGSCEEGLPCLEIAGQMITRMPDITRLVDRLEAAVETLRALWSKGTKPYDGERVRLPETTCYPRPLNSPAIVVGGGGERRTLQIAARFGDACDLRTDVALEHKIAVFRRHCEEVGRNPDEVAVTVSVIVTGKSL